MSPASSSLGTDESPTDNDASIREKFKDLAVEAANVDAGVLTWVGCGTYRVLAESSPSPSSRCHKLASAQRRQLDDEIDLVGFVMEGEATLSLGTVTVGPHA
ncbi:MAG: hypothetical protein E6I30_05915 [Chloroflexi bacterium]|nr:MAG: hypothetical protein E6I30_05915 [Chloroflexota bacterium]TMG56900.1 MAG: hypothetical protein E6H83_16025 [Chloroflexota bacterium]